VEFLPRGSFQIKGARGYGAHNQSPGTWTDDTPPALCPAGSLPRGFDPAGIARNFVKWRGEGAFAARGQVFDSGISTAKAIRNLKAGTGPGKAGRSGETENGGLMRIAPPVFYTGEKPEPARFTITKTASAITRARARPVAACFIYPEYPRKLPGDRKKTPPIRNRKMISVTAARISTAAPFRSLRGSCGTIYTPRPNPP
jgi:ADP-ribosylglycohydrolase